MADVFGSQDLLSPYEVIFSCSICQATVRDLECGTARSELNDGRTNGSAPRLWLTECGHISCSEHFEDGGRSASRVVISVLNKSRTSIPSSD